MRVIASENKKQTHAAVARLPIETVNNKRGNICDTEDGRQLPTESILMYAISRETKKNSGVEATHGDAER
jgi:hypothetical protein